MIRQPKVARDTARKGRTSAIITLKPLVVNAPADLPRVPRWALESGAHQSLRPISGVCNEQPDSLGEALTESLSTPLAPPRHRGASPTTPCSMTSAPRRRRHCGRHTVSCRLRGGVCSSCSATTQNGSVPRQRLGKLCGACPIPASSGQTSRHRLYRGGHRQANAALYPLAPILHGVGVGVGGLTRECPSDLRLWG